MSNCNCFQTATRVVSLVGISLFRESFAALFFHPDKGVVVMAAYWQRTSVAGALDDGASLERVFNVMLNCNCFQTATRVVSLVGCCP